MLTRIKIQCGCGQRYAFDIEPIGNTLPGPVSCPACAADGTAAGNAILAQRAAAPAEIAVAAPALVAAGGSGGVAQMHFAAAAPTARSAPAATVAHAHAAAPVEKRRLPGQLEPERARNEARSKILWGDDPADVAKFLQAQGFNIQEAQETIAPLLAERASTVRNAGKAKIITGIGMMCVPVIAFVIFLVSPIFPIKLFGVAVAIGFWGLWRAITGTIMFVSPKSEKGDIGDM
jgi:hypothetical protein